MNQYIDRIVVYEESMKIVFKAGIGVEEKGVRNSRGEGVIGYGDPYYLIERIIKGRNVDVNDGSHIIYVNGKYRADDDIGWLMHDFNCSDPEKMHYDILKEKARFLKETVERMIQDGVLPDEKIAQYSGLTVSQVKALREEMKTTVMA